MKNIAECIAKRMARHWPAPLFVALLVIAVGGGDVAAARNSLALLDGTWRGWGWIELWSGDRERLRCKVVYRVSRRGSRATQSLVCASTSYKMDARSSLRVRGGRVSGSWRETSFGANGRLSGTARGKTISLNLVGGEFSAAMYISTGRCRQTVTIRPRGVEVRKVSMGLRKRC